MKAQKEMCRASYSIGRNNDSNMYMESKKSNLPTVGARVRRGPDWHWNEQDSYGPGTVIGHHPNGRRG